MTEDFYDLLDVSPGASQETIKEAYREQVRVYHPDLNDDDRAQAQFSALKTAYDTLGDPVERQAYDRLGHEKYVAKRTSGLPSPDLWKTGDEESGEAETRRKATATASGTSTGSAGTGSSSRSRSTASTGTGSGSTGRSAGGRGGRTGSTTGGTGRGTGRSKTGTGRSRSRHGTGSDGASAVVRWWRRQNFSLPLIWLSMLVYLSGLVHFALTNESALEGVWTELTALGADPDALVSVLSAGRHGVDTTVAYVAAIEPVAPPASESLWYAALAGVVALTLLALVAARIVRDRETRGPVTIDETIVVALALTVTTTLVGGPLLAGAVLMPVLFVVIVRHTRRGPGWKPSYLYVLPVLAPAAGFALAATADPPLAVDLVAFVLLPIVGALGLPLRATIRKRFGR